MSKIINLMPIRKFKETFGISKSTSVEFVNIPIETDLLAFICPFLIVNSKANKLSSDIYQRMTDFLMKLNRDFITTNDKKNGLIFLSHLHEPNEYHLGYSPKNKGKAISKSKSEVIFDSLRNNRFAKAGVSVTNEAHNVLLLVKGIGQDIMSDVIANVCRDILADFTLNQCSKYGIAVNTAEIQFYNPATQKWETKIVKLPFYKAKRLILIPRNVVSGDRAYSRYYNYFVTSNYVSADILNGVIKVPAKNKFIREFNNGTKRAIIKEIYKVYGKKDKNDLVDFVRQYTKSLLEFQLYAKSHYPELDLSAIG